MLYWVEQTHSSSRSHLLLNAASGWFPVIAAYSFDWWQSCSTGGGAATSPPISCTVLISAAQHSTAEDRVTRTRGPMDVLAISPHSPHSRRDKIELGTSTLTQELVKRVNLRSRCIAYREGCAIFCSPLYPFKIGV